MGHPLSSELGHYWTPIGRWGIQRMRALCPSFNRTNTLWPGYRCLVFLLLQKDSAVNRVQQYNTDCTRIRLEDASLKAWWLIYSQQSTSHSNPLTSLTLWTHAHTMAVLLMWCSLTISFWWSWEMEGGEERILLDDKVRDRASDLITEGSAVLLQQVYHEDCGALATCLPAIWVMDRDL